MKYTGRYEWRSNQDKYYLLGFSKLWAIKRIPFYIDRKQSNRISGGD
jgi:hypothetical protein